MKLLTTRPSLGCMRGEDITVYGNGAQTRSFCFVDDLIEGLVRLMNTGDEVTGSKSKIVNKPLPGDDPLQCKPDLSLARATLKGWEPATALDAGLQRTIAYLDKQISIDKSA